MIGRVNVRFYKGRVGFQYFLKEGGGRVKCEAIKQFQSDLKFVKQENDGLQVLFCIDEKVFLLMDGMYIGECYNMVMGQLTYDLKKEMMLLAANVFIFLAKFVS